MMWYCQQGNKIGRLLIIIGPKVYSKIAEKSVYRILKRVENKLINKMVHLCGKISTSLEAIGLLRNEEVEIDGKYYFEMIKSVGKERGDMRFIGHWCLKMDKSKVV